ALGRHPQSRECFEVVVNHQFQISQRRDEIRSPDSLDLLEEWLPLARVIEPLFPARIELFLHRFRQAPQGSAAGSLEALVATVGRDGEDRARLGEVVRPREATPGGGATEGADLTTGFPAPGE